MAGNRFSAANAMITHRASLGVACHEQRADPLLEEQLKSRRFIVHCEGNPLQFRPTKNLKAAVAMRNIIADLVRSVQSALRLVQRARRILLTLASFCLVAAASTSSSIIAGPSQGNDRPAILLFVGKGTSPGDVAALKQILNRNHLDFAAADSNQFNELTESQFAAYRLLIIPGGNFEDIGKGLSATTTANIRRAVRGGLNYLGICARAFFAGNSPITRLISPKAYASRSMPWKIGTFGRPRLRSRLPDR
jgi:hypothetical protein